MKLERKELLIILSVFNMYLKEHSGKDIEILRNKIIEVLKNEN